METTRKFDPINLEKKVLEYWEAEKVYKKLFDLRADGPKYYYLDGPPYANMPPHIGHARTRAIRDPFLKYYRMKGHDVRLQAGFDCHGLPIEVKVEEDIGSRNKGDIEEYGVDKFLQKCRERALRFMKVWTDFYRRFGMHLDFDNPYLTLNNEFIESSWLFFKRAEEKGLLYEGLRSVDWCTRCETPLSNYEASDTYKEVEDISVYVKFPVKGESGKFIFIWTTTPWTLPSNIAVSVNPKFEYAWVKTDHGTLLVAKEAVKQVMETVGIDKYAIVETVKGKDLEGLKYDHIFLDEVPIHKDLSRQKHVHEIVLANYVTLEDGTGLVHTAPGHGADDYGTGVQYHLPIFSPLDSKGHFTKEGGKYEGMFVFDANKLICQDLNEKKLLLKELQFTHRYAHCWRCGTPLIAKASKQWFIAVEKIKDKLLKENKKVKWIPAWAGEKRFNDWLEGIRDWCISRQRYWGIPLPIWRCDTCEKYEVFGSLGELSKRTDLPEMLDLHKPQLDEIEFKCKCGGTMGRVPDIADVWFDSGSTTWSSLNYPKDKKLFDKFFPVDFITEGLDQTRGWFYTLMVEGVVAFGKTPFNAVLMNDFVLDKDGNKMSKSIGNVVDPYEAFDKYGSDITRLYLLWETQPWEKLYFNWDNARVVYKIMNILWNSYSFSETYMRLHNFDPATKPKELMPEDKWILSRMETLTAQVTDCFENYDLFRMVRALCEFITEDFSRWYIKLIRPRVKGDDPDSCEAALYTLYKVLTRLSRLLAPIVPFISEEIYLNLEKGLSVHAEEWPEAGKRDEKLEQGMEETKLIFEAVSRARQRAGMKLKYPLPIVYLPGFEKGLEGIIAQICNVKEVSFIEPEVQTRAKPNFKALGPKHGNKVAALVKALEKEDMPKLRARLKKGKVKIGEFELSKEDLVFEESGQEGIAQEEAGAKKIYLDTRQDEALKQESLMRELVRNIQELRKSSGYMVGEQIYLTLGTDENTAKTIEKFSEQISSMTGTKTLSVEKPKRKLGTCKFGDVKIDIDFRKA